MICNNAYQKFSEQLFQLLEQLKQTNIICARIIDNIGYVEPDNMQQYKEKILQFMNFLGQFMKLTINATGVFKIHIKDSSTNFSQSNLVNEFGHIGEETTKLFEFNNKVNETYNYKNSNMVQKRSPLNLSSSGADYADENGE